MPRSRDRRIVIALVGLIVAVVLFGRFGPRPSFLPLATAIEGPPPAAASSVVVFLHGRGGGLVAGERIAHRLREAGLSRDVSIVLVEAPYSTGFGHSWGDTAAAQTTSRARLRERLRDLLAGVPRERVVLAGYSQGAGLAIDMVAEDPSVGALASLSPCYSWLRGELRERSDVRYLLAHGAHDDTCKVEESRSLARSLSEARKPVQYIEFDGPHSLPDEVLRALAVFAAPR